MTNLEFYKGEIMKNHTNFCRDFMLPNILAPMKAECSNYDCEDPNAEISVTCTQCHLIQSAWLLEEHKEPEVDWSTVPIGTPVLVRDDNNSQWFKRHFAGVDKYGNITAWVAGKTSFTMTDACVWKYAKLWEGSEEQAEEERQKQEAAG